MNSKMTFRSLFDRLMAVIGQIRATKATPDENYNRKPSLACGGSNYHYFARE
jgi:hypothetical protein